VFLIADGSQYLLALIKFIQIYFSGSWNKFS